MRPPRAGPALTLLRARSGSTFQIIDSGDGVARLRPLREADQRLPRELMRRYRRKRLWAKFVGSRDR